MIPSPAGGSTPTSGSFRKGKWTPEEEAYLMAIVRYFNLGLMNIPAGKSLRSLLSEKLNCDPMRITKKYSGSSAVGKQTFVPCEPTEENNQARISCEQDLNDLQQRFLLALSAPSTGDSSGDNYTLIADGSGSWMSVDEHTFHFSKKSKIHKSASAPALNRMAEDNNRYIDRSSITSMTSESRTRANSLKAYAMDDTAAGNLLLDFFESVRSDVECTKVSVECSRPMSTILEDGGEKKDEPGCSVSPLSKVENEVGVPKLASLAKAEEIVEDSSATKTENCTEIIDSVREAIGAT